MTAGVEKQNKIELTLEEQLEIRDLILAFESSISEQDEAFFGDTDNCPLKHHFADDIYVREIFIPEGTLLTGKLHRHSHPNFLMSGCVAVLTESNGVELLEGPLAMISKAGTKRALYVLEDTTWITVHSNVSNTQDLKKIEKFVIAPNYKEYEMSLLPWYKKLLFKLKNI